MKYFNLGMAAAIVVLFGLFLSTWDENLTLRTRLDQAEITLGEMSKEHDRAINAAQSALRAREEIHAKQNEKIRIMENALDANADFGSIPVPDDIRMCWQGGNCENSEVSASGNPAR